MRTIVVALLLLVSAATGSSRISIGGVDLEVPSPTGFAPVTADMVRLFNFQKQFVAPTNEEFVGFVSEEGIPLALKGDIPDLRRRFSVQTAKSIVSRSVSRSAFASLKDTIKTQNDDYTKKAQAELSKHMGRLNSELTKQYDLDVALSVSNMVPLAIHEDTDRTLAYSAFVKFEARDDSGVSTPVVSVVTSTFVHIRSKVLFLYCYADEDGLDWSRRTSAAWAAAVVAANPSDLPASLRESLPAGVTSIDWGKVGTRAAVGAMIGMIVGLIGWIRSRRSAS